MKKLGLCLLSLCLVGYAVGCAKEDAKTPQANTGTETGTTNPDDADADKIEQGEEGAATEGAAH